MIVPYLPSDRKDSDLKKAILLVDSQEDSRLIISALLKQEGHRVSSCSDVGAATSLIGAEPFDFAIVEHSTSGLDGLGLLEKIKEHNLRIPVLVISAQYEMEPYLVAMNLGALDFFGKPVDYGEIQRLIKTYC